MTGYIRNDTTNNIANGNVINAADLDGEFDAIQTAFDASTGHTHDGTVGGGAPIEALGPAQDVVITTSVLRPKTDNTVDLGTSTLEFKDLYLDGTAKVDTLTVDESATITANLTVNGNTTLGNAATDTVTVTADVASHLIPATDNTYDLGGASDEWRNLYIDGTAQVDTLQVDESATITANLTVNGNTTLGNAATDTVTVTADVASHLIPATDDTYDLGTSTDQWRDLYIDGTANIDTLVADTATISAGTATLSAGTIITSTGGVLTLQRDDTAITTGETLGEIDFQAPNVSGGGDAIVVAATIRAVARDTFDSTVNKTSLLFETANSGAVTTRMEIDGTGNVAVDTNTLYVDATNNRVGVLTVTPATQLEVVGTIRASGSGPILSILDSGGATDEKEWSIRGGDGPLNIFALNEAGSGGGDAIQFTRVGNSVRTIRGLRSSTTTYDLSNYDRSLMFSGGVSTIGTATAHDFVFESNDTERMRISAAGNVGIGTTTPSAPLSVVGDIVGTRSLGLGTVGVDATCYLSQYRSTVETIWGPLTSRALFGTVSNHDVAFFTNNLEKMRLTAAGNVGIGTSSPEAILHVEAPAFNSSEATATAGLFIKSQGGTTGDGNFSSGLSFSQINSTRPLASIAAVQTTSDPDQGGLAFLTHSSSASNNVVGEAMRITHAGNVGIGTASPTGNLTIGGSAPRLDFLETGGSAGFDNTVLIRDADVFAIQTRNVGTFVSNDYRMTTNASGALTHEWRIGNTERMRINSSGDVGIGTASPQRQLHLASSVPSIRLEDTDVSGLYAEVVQLSDGDLSIRADHGNVQASTSISFSLDATERMRIDSSGNVGIGTAAPAHKLDVEGTITGFVIGPQGLADSAAAPGLYVYNDSDTGFFRPASNVIGFTTGGTEAARIDSSGNLLVGGTSANPATAGGNPAQSALAANGQILAAVTSDGS